MDHQNHVHLLRNGIPRPGGTWADFGSGRGAFTLALAELVGPAGKIYSMDKDEGSLRQGERALQAQFPDITIQYLRADFTKPLDLPPLDGLIIANALHFLPQKDKTVRLLRSYLRPAGRFILVEYNTDRGNHWVPQPMTNGTRAALAQRCGFQHTELLATVPSSFLGEFFSAVSW
jgi:ubiquinone/menaquinone biosynthesis C-methylase UbiE